jgi:radial spoke head protein 4A
VEAPNGEGEAEPEAEEEGAEPVDKEAPGVGVTKFCYYVAANAFDTWKKLPDVSPAEIDMSRKIKVLLTGNLERDIITNPFFFGKEKNYLRAQIARISHSTTLLPAGQWKLDEENAREIVAEEGPEEGELMQAATNAMANPSMWQHGNQNILLNCKTQHPEVEEPEGAENFDPELAQKMVEAADPYEPRLKSITEDCKVGLSEKIT